MNNTRTISLTIHEFLFIQSLIFGNTVSGAFAEHQDHQGGQREEK